VRVSGQIATAAIAITAIAVWIGADSSILPPERHLDGQGPLASLNSSGPHGLTTVDPTQGSVWTFGYRLCLAQGDQPAVIDSIGPTQTVGSGFKYLGSLIRTFDVQPGVDSVHEPIGAVHGFPPPPEYAPDYLRPAIGYPVAILCSSGQPSPPVTYTELLVGLAAVGTNGGGWLGIDVGYTVGGRHRIVSLGYDVLVCGPSTETECANGTAPDGQPTAYSVPGHTSQVASRLDLDSGALSSEDAHRIVKILCRGG
jgi:hypothetical protein